MLKSIQMLALASLVCSFFAFSTVAFSADEPADEQAPVKLSAAAKEFQKLDVNKDGSIDKKEATKNKKLSKSFKKLAKKGKMNEAAFTKWFEKKPAKAKKAKKG